MPNSLLNPEDYIGSIRPFITKTEDAIHDSRSDIKTCFVAANIYPGKHSYFALDVNHVNEDYETAHTDMTLIPVYHLRLSKRKFSIARQPTLDGTVAQRIREMHNGHGDDPLPLLDDFTRMTGYCNPRSMYRP